MSSKDKNTKIKRRSFIKQSSAMIAGGTIASATCFNSLADASSRQATSSISPIPKIKPQLRAPINAVWTRLADMPFATQEIYPSGFWSQEIQETANTKEIINRRPQRFNALINAGGIIGRSGGRFIASDKVTIYDPIADQWRYGPDLPQSWHHLHLVAHNGFLYGLGGFTIEPLPKDADLTRGTGGWTMRPDIMRLDTKKKRWVSLNPMPSPQAEAVCVSLNGFIHVVGGRSPAGSMNDQWSDHIDTDRHYMYDTRRDQWFERASMSVARNSTAGVSLNSALYVFGGRTVNGGNSNITEVYDPLADRWQTLRPMPEAQGGLAAAALGNTIFIFGGEYFNNGGGVYSKTWAYDTREDRWRSAPPMPRPRHGLGAVTINNSIYVMGGAARPSGVGTSAVLDRFMVS